MADLGLLTLNYTQMIIESKNIDLPQNPPLLIADVSGSSIAGFQTAENSRREFKIPEMYNSWIEIIGGYAPLQIGTKFTATIENNIVTKIELL